MYVCDNGHIFDEPIEVTEYMGYGIWETYGVCPECGASFEPAERCAECGEWFAPDDLNADGLCRLCELVQVVDDEDNE